MNKKLFSWKALAGLALLVAMGLTSCKPGAEVDPSDPTGQTKPTKPSIVVNNANVNITITKAADFKAQWDATVVGDVLKKLKEADEVNVTVKAAGYELDGTKITVPKIWDTPNAKVLNITFDSFAKTEKALTLDVDQNAGATVNITLPSQTLPLDLTASAVRSSIKSAGEATVSELTGTTSDKAKNALKVATGVTVNALNLTSGLVAKDGGEVVAVVLNADPSWDDATKKNAVKANGITFENLIIAGTVDIDGNKDNTKINNIDIKDGAQLTITTVNSIGNINGLADFSKGGSSKVKVKDQLAKVGALKNVEIIDAAGLEVKNDVFAGAIFDNDIKLSAASLSKATVKGDVAVNITANDKTIAFNGVDAKTITVTGAVSTQTDVIKTSYKWDNEKWVKQDAVIADATEYTYKSGKFEVTSAGKLVDNDDDQAVPADKYEITIVETKTVNMKPKNAVIALDTDCKVAGAKISGSNITDLFGGAQASKPFFTVTCGAAKFAWEEGSDSKFYLIAQ
jgi:hypothetical protein